jgi:hypothetical protein
MACNRTDSRDTDVCEEEGEGGVELGHGQVSAITEAENREGGVVNASLYLFFFQIFQCLYRTTPIAWKFE